MIQVDIIWSDEKNEYPLEIDVPMLALPRQGEIIHLNAPANEWHAFALDECRLRVRLVSHFVEIDPEEIESGRSQVRSHLELYVEPANEHTRQQIQRLQAEGRLWNAPE